MVVDGERRYDGQRRRQTPLCSVHGEGDDTSKLRYGGKGRLIQIRTGPPPLYAL